jgi:hypothetical protein
LCAAAVGLLIAAGAGFLSFRRSRDPIAAAELIDRKLQCRQEVLTLATLADSNQSGARSPLFPVLWNRAAKHIERLDPRRSFPFQTRETLHQAVFLTVCTTGVIIACLSVLMAANKPPLLAQARQLRRIAREIANSGPADAQTQELAARLRAAADTLENPGIPPETKLEQLDRVEQEVKSEQQRKQQETPQNKGNSSAGKSSGKGNQGQGAGESNGGTGQAKSAGGQGPGKGEGKGTGNGAGKGEVQLAQASKDISRIQARLEAEAKTKSAQSSAGNRLKVRSPRPGEQPDLARLDQPGNTPNLNQFKSGRERNQEQGNTQRTDQGQERKDFGSSKGDTHLGQFPRPGNFERFYKTGEHGEPLDIKNARYVVFRIPPALISAGAGKSTPDNERPSATVPYANLPLKDERIAADPDERQLVPPRYRDLLR